jgi:hypothetical protein
MRTEAAWSAGGALWLAAGLIHGTAGWRFDAASILWLTADVLLAVGLVGLFALRPWGDSRVAPVALVGALVGRGFLAIGEVVTLLDGHDENPFIPLGALLSALCLVVVGVAVLRRGRDTGGAGRWSYLVMGVFPFLVMFPVVAATGEPSYLLIALWGLPAIAVGAAIAPLSARRPTTTEVAP